MKINKKTGMALCAVGFVLFGMVGQMDYEEAVMQERVYAEMVCDGHWPDYENRKPDCASLEKKDD
jgi:hypothetical protein